MANLISIVGGSGSGKSTSIQYLNPKETFVIAVTKKDLPFGGTMVDYAKYHPKTNPEGNHYTTHKAVDIIKLLGMINKRKDIKYVVIDDVQYIMGKQAMERSKEKNFDKHVDIASDYNAVIEKALSLRDDLYIFTLTHADVEKDRDGNITSAKIKTLGAMLDKVVTVDGLYTWNLWCEKLVDYDDEGNEMTYHVFKTNDPTGISTCKTPYGAFEDMYIPNSLELVVESIEAYRNRPKEKAPLTKIPSNLNRKVGAPKPSKNKEEKIEEIVEEVKEVEEKSELDEDDDL